MTREEIAETARRLQGSLVANGAGSLNVYRKEIAALYWTVCRKTLRQCNCKDVLSDAVIEINVNIKKGYTMAKANLKNGAVIQFDGGIYTNANITDDVARRYLALFPQRAGLFAALPGDEETAPAGETPAPVAVKKKTVKKAKK